MEPTQNMKPLTRETLDQAFSIMGQYLRDRRVLGEIVIYGGSALMLTFEWRASTHDVDAIVAGDHHGKVQAASDEAARRLGLARSWLNENVSVYASRHEGPSDTNLIGMYPDYGAPGLRVMVAGPRYLFAMKLLALRRGTEFDRDFEDAVHLAKELDITSYDEMREIIEAYYPEEPIPALVELRLRDLLERLSNNGPKI
jgi:hypothetical protein